MHKKRNSVTIAAVILIAGCLLLAAWLTLRSSSPEVLRLGYLRIGSDLPYFVGDELGIFTSNGLTVSGVRLGDSNQVMEALLAGQLDATDIIGSSVVLAAALDRQGEFRIFMMSAATEESNIHRLIARPGAGIHDVHDLAGRKLAVFPGTQMRAYTLLLLSSFMNPAEVKSVELVPLTPPQQVQAMEEGRVDAALTLEPTGTELLKSKAGETILDNVLYENISKPRPFVTAFAVVRQAWIDDNPKSAQRLLAAYQEIAALIRERPEQARQVLQNALRVEPDVASSASLYEYTVGRHIDPADVEHTARVMVNTGVLDRVPSASQLLYK